MYICFPVHINVMFTLCCDMCAITLCLKINVLILILKYLFLKNANHLYLQQDIIFCNSNINDNRSQITIIYIIMMEKFEILGEVPNGKERHEVNKWYWNNGTDRLGWLRVATTLIYKNAVSAKCNRAKCNQMRYVHK